MGRQPRDLQSSNVLHVTNRGNDRQDIFSLDVDWQLFEADLAEQCDRYGVAVLAYAWMTNHFHMVVECQDVAALPNMMRSFQSSYARRYNVRTARTGSLFEKAYFSRPVIGDEDLLRTARYVHLNPVEIVGERALPAYRWSSLAVFIGRRPRPGWLRTDRLGGLIGSGTYLADLRTPHRWDRLPMGFLPPRRRSSIPEIVEAVHRCGDSIGHGLRDDLICHLAVALRTAPPHELAATLGVDPSTVRRRARRGRVACSTDPAIDSLVARALDVMAGCA